MQSWLDAVITHPHPRQKEMRVVHYLQTFLVYLSCYASDMLDNPRFLTLVFRFLTRLEGLETSDGQEVKLRELVSIYLAQIAHRLVNTRSLSLLNFLRERKFLKVKKENDADDEAQRDDDEMRQVMAARLVKLSRSVLLKLERKNDVAYCSQLNDRLAEYASGKKKDANPEPFFERVEERVEAIEIIAMAEKQLCGK